ncbi:uncharacterized protein LOC135955451 [Calliphora vicina]|uniref:uncharacterized protein LOC135955451 n=1 Tax=Calliphora vicina TaxID=7373 RepID=UPI00325B1067
MKFPTVYNSFNIEAVRQGVNNKSIDILPTSLHTYDPDAGGSSDVLWLVKSYIMAPYPAPLSKSKYFMQPYTYDTVFYIHLLLVFCALAVAFIHYRPHYINEVDFTKSILYVLALFLYQNQLNFKIKTNRQKLVYSLIFLNGFIFTNLYMAKLSSLLVQDIYGTKVEKLEDLNNTNIQLLVRKMDYNYLQTLSNIPEVIMKKAILIDYFDLYKAHRDLNNTHLLMALHDKIIFILFQQRFLKVPRMYRINEVLYTMPEYFTVRRDLPYIQLFNRYLKYVMESGILYKFVVDTNFDGIQSGEIRFFHDTENNGGIYLSFDYFYAPLICFVFGMILALSVLLLELIYFKYVNK